MFIALLFFYSLIILGCPFAGVRADAELLFAGKYGGVPWKDSYIAVVPAAYSTQVQLWDSDTGRLVKKYDVLSEKNKMPVLECAVMFKKIWITAGVSSPRLLCLDLASGVVSVVKLDIEPEYLVALPSVTGKCGAVWVSTFSKPGVGFRARQLDSNGQVIKEVNVNHPDILFDGLGGLRYVHGKFLLLAGSHGYVSEGENKPSAFSLINLSARN